jgi:flagella basal body P-ring formation protein FlgA
MEKFAAPFVRCMGMLASMALSASAACAQTAPARQDVAAIGRVVEQFLATQTAGMPGQVTIRVTPVDPRANLAACAAPQAFLAGGSRPWGKTTVGVRCSEPANWTIYVAAHVQVMADYIATARPIAQGEVIGEQDVVKMHGDLAALPAGVVTDSSAVVGRTLAVSLRSGMPLRQDALRQKQAVQQGQMVKLMTSGQGFRISSEARALNNAADGQVAQVRTASGQVVSGVARSGGVVEVVF